MASSGGFGATPEDRLVLVRYLALFLAYDVGGNREVEHIKSELADHITGGAQLRPDAAHLLLMLADQMIIRPYSGSITPFADGLPDSDPPMNAAETRQRLDRTLKRLVTALEQANAPRPRSSHAVLKALLEIWPQLKMEFGWA